MLKNTKEFNKKIAVLFVTITFFSSFSPMFARKAEAQWVDIVQSVKEFGLDTLAWLLINRTIERMSASTVNWINSGFKGSPAYVTNPEKYFLNIGDEVAGQYILKDPNLDFLCGPISAKIRLALANNYTGDRDRWQCTLTQVGKNMDNFMNNFENGGWDNFFEISQKQQNNPIGAYLMAEGELFNLIANKKDLAEKDLTQGAGFMSFKKCTQTVPGSSGQDIVGFDGKPTGRKLPPQCMPGKEETVTPGSAIQSKLNEALGAGSRKLEVADEINEIVSALLNQLLSKAIGGVMGLRGTSERDLSETDKDGKVLPPVTDRLEIMDPRTPIEGRFGETTDISAIEDPIPPVPDPSSFFPPGTTITTSPPPTQTQTCNPATDPTCPESPPQ